MVGRKPLGPALVAHLDGSSSAKQRLELILATIAGKVSVVDAAWQLGISEAMFYKLRTRVLQVSLEDLEPKPMGRPAQRPSAEDTERAELAATVDELRRELAAQTVRLELAHVMPHLLERDSSSALKKTTRQKRRQKQRRLNKSRRSAK